MIQTSSAATFLPRLVLPPLALLAGVALTACIEFDAQEVHLHYDGEDDRLDIMLVYHGLFAEGNDVQDAANQLDEAMLEGDFAFWSNWPLKVETVDGNRGALLKRFVEIENGGLFTTPAGTLGGYQFLRVRNVEQLVRAANTVFSLYVQTQVLAGKGVAAGHEFDEETRDLIQDHLRGREHWFEFDGAALRLTLPCSAADHRWLMSQGVDRILDGVISSIRSRLQTQRVVEARAQDEEVGDYSDFSVNTSSQEFSLDKLESLLEVSPFVRFFVDNPCSIMREQGRTTLIIGIAGTKQQTVHKAPSGRYEPNLLDHLRQTGKHKIEDGVPAQELARRFEAFRGREPVMPKAYAEFVGN